MESASLATGRERNAADGCVAGCDLNTGRKWCPWRLSSSPKPYFREKMKRFRGVRDMGLLRCCGLYRSVAIVCSGQELTGSSFGATRPPRRYLPRERTMRRRRREDASSRYCSPSREILPLNEAQHILDGCNEIRLDTLGRSSIEDQRLGRVTSGAASRVAVAAARRARPARAKPHRF